MLKDTQPFITNPMAATKCLKRLFQMLYTFLNSDTDFKRARNLFTDFKLKENKSWLR